MTSIDIINWNLDQVSAVVQETFLLKMFHCKNMSQIKSIVFLQCSQFHLPDLKLDTLELDSCGLSRTQATGIFENVTAHHLIIQDCYPGNMFHSSFCQSVRKLTIDSSKTLSILPFRQFWNFLENFPNLESLHICDSLMLGDWNALIQEQYASGFSFEKLTELNVSKNTQFFIQPEWTVKFHRVFPNVKTIMMANCNLAQQDVIHLQRWIEACKFQHVFMDDNPGIQFLPKFSHSMESFSANQCSFPVQTFLDDCILNEKCQLKTLTLCVRNLHDFWKSWNILTRSENRITTLCLNLKSFMDFYTLTQSIQKTRFLSVGSYEDSKPVDLSIVLPPLCSWTIRSELTSFFRECFPSMKSQIFFV